MSAEDLPKIGLGDLTDGVYKEKGKRYASTLAREAVSSDNLVIKYGAAASRKPELYDPEPCVIADYMEQFETYVMHRTWYVLANTTQLVL